MCFSNTTTDSVEAAAESMDTAFLDNLMPAKPDTVWFAHIQLNSKQTPFKLDTGAEVTAISGATHQHLGKPKLSHPDKLLYGPSRQPLGEKKTASTWPPLQVALWSETDVFTLLPATSTSETARVLIRTDGLIRRK